MNYKKWIKLKAKRDKLNAKMSEAWMENGNCDSKCPKCGQWESHWNKVDTKPLDDGTEHRMCLLCGYKWYAIFTPAGFMPIEKQGE